jgi:transposase, IS30 family
MSHLTLRERVLIQYNLDETLYPSLQLCAQALSIHPSSLYRELKRNVLIKRSRQEYFLKSEQPLMCGKLNRYPYVCNACKKVRNCSRTLYLYDAYEADARAYQRLVIDRKRPTLSVEALRHLDQVVSPLVKARQSLYHILASHPELEVSQSSLRRYIHQNLLSCHNIDLPRTVRFRVRSEAPRRRQRIAVSILAHRTYQDYQMYLSEKPRITLQLDTMIGKSTDKKCLLTLYEPSAKFQWAYLVYRSAYAVNTALARLIDELECNHQLFFDCLLSDNGAEFQLLPQLERRQDHTQRLRVFYCDPYASYQKGGCERNHALIRYLIKKGESFDNAHQSDIDALFSHINSLKRKSLQGVSSIQRFEHLFHRSIPETLHIFEIPASKLKLTKSS